MMSDVTLIECEQNSPEWFAARLGVPTASRFDALTAKGRGSGESEQRLSYMEELAAEILMGARAASFSTADTERGHMLEPEARELYGFIRGVSPVPTGFFRNGRAGASPDSLVGGDGLLEIKTKKPRLQIRVLREGVLPDEHKPQCQGQLMVTGRAFVDFFSYCPGLPPFLKRVERDERYIAKLKVAVTDFCDELDSMVRELEIMK